VDVGVVERMVHDGYTFCGIEERIQQTALPGQRPAALWRFTWSQKDQLTQRVPAEETPTPIATPTV
jgi:hypothetical protein